MQEFHSPCILHVLAIQLPKILDGNIDKPWYMNAIQFRLLNYRLHLCGVSNQSVIIPPTVQEHHLLKSNHPPPQEKLNTKKKVLVSSLLSAWALACSCSETLPLPWKNHGKMKCLHMVIINIGSCIEVPCVSLIVKLCCRHSVWLVWTEGVVPQPP